MKELLNLFLGLIGGEAKWILIIYKAQKFLFRKEGGRIK
jgi:hypothetical protein